MKNGEYKIYKGATITKVSGGRWLLNGREVESYEEAKREVDFSFAEDNALRQIDDYVVDVVGGWF